MSNHFSSLVRLSLGLASIVPMLVLSGCGSSGTADTQTQAVANDSQKAAAAAAAAQKGAAADAASRANR